MGSTTTHLNVGRMQHQARYKSIYAVTGRMLIGAHNHMREHLPGLDLEERLILFAAFIADHERRPMLVSKLASYTGIPRTTVLRKVSRMVGLGLVEFQEDKTVVPRQDGHPSGAMALAGKLERVIKSAAEDLRKLR